MPGVEPAEYDKMDAVEQELWWYRALHTHILDLVRQRPPGTRLLDAGCGTGGLLTRLREDLPDLDAVGLDYAHAAASRAQAKAGLAVVAGTVLDLPFADRSFGMVVSLDVLCHAAVEPEPALREMTRVLQPGGKLVLNLPAYEWLRSAHDIRVRNGRRFTARGIRRLLTEAGLSPIRICYWNALLLPLMVVQRKILARAPDSSSDVAPLHPWLNRGLLAATRLERRLMAAGLPFPAGGSVLAMATKE